MESATVAMAEQIWVVRVVPNISTAILIAFEYIKTLGSVGISSASADVGGEEADKAISVVESIRYRHKKVRMANEILPKITKI